MIGMTEVSLRGACPKVPLGAKCLAIRNTLIFYAAHLAISANKPPQLIMLSDDKGNRELAQAEGLLAISTRGYVDGLVPTERDKLVDLVVGGVDALGDGERRGRRIYDEVGLSSCGWTSIADDSVPIAR